MGDQSSLWFMVMIINILLLLYIVYYDYCTTTAFPTASITPSTQQVVASDENVRLTCSGSGDPNPTYTWRIQYENGKG